MQRMWQDPSSISTREVEIELRKNPNSTPNDNDLELTDGSK